MRDSGLDAAKHNEYNPYVEKNFGSGGLNLYQNLHTFRMTGGEPLLSKDVWKVLDYIETTR